MKKYNRTGLLNKKVDEVSQQNADLAADITEIQGMIDDGELGGSLTINPNHVFVDNSARDTYFESHESEIVDGIYISVGSGFQRREGDAWVDKTAVIQSPDTKFPITNFIPDGNFPDGSTVWTGFQGSISISGNVATNTGSGSGNIPGIRQTTSVPLVAGDVLRIRARMRVTNSDCTKLELKIGGTSTGEFIVKEIGSPVENEWYDINAYYTVPSSGLTGNIKIILQHRYTNGATASGKVLECEYVIGINLTNSFGTRIPVNSQITEWLTKYPHSWFKGTVNLFDVDEIVNHLMDYRPRNGAYRKINELGYFEFSSTPNPDWDNWNYIQFSYGFNHPTKSPIYNQVHGTLETDAMFSVWAKYGRWTPATGGNHRFGGHIFEGWNNIRSYRFTILIGNNREDEACIQVYSPTDCYANPIGELTQDQMDNRITQLQEDRLGAGTTYFGRVRIGSDVEDQGYVFKRSKAEFYGDVTFYGSAGSIFKSVNTGALRIGACTPTLDDGAYIDMKGGANGSNYGKMEFYIGDYTQSIDPLNTWYGFNIKNMGAGVLPIAKLRGDGQFTTKMLKVTNPRKPSSATDTGEQGEIAWDVGYLYVCTATNTWKRVALTSW